MVALVDRKIGCFHPTPRKGSTYPNTLPLLEAQLGRVFDNYSTFIDFTFDYPGKPGSVYPHTDVRDAVEVSGRDLFIGFQTVRGYFPDGTTNATTGTPNYAGRHITFGELLAGAYDATIDAIFTYLLSLRKPGGAAPTIYVRPFWEGNLSSAYWFPADAVLARPANLQPTGTAGTGYPVTPGRTWTNDAGDPVCTSIAQYIAAFRYLMGRAKALTGGSRVKACYIPGNTDSRTEMNRGAAGCTAANMYPGDAYVDYVGWDIYNGLQSRWTTPLETLRGIRLNDQPESTRATGAQPAYPYAYDMFEAIAPTKPMMIGEINCQEPGDTSGNPPGSPSFGSGQSKAAWYRDLWAIGDDLPKLEIVNFFNNAGTRATYPVSSSGAAFDAFQQGFTTRTTSSTWTVAPGYVPTDGDTPASPDPTDNLTRDVIPGKPTGSPGNAMLHRVARWFLRQITFLDAGGNVNLRAVGDGKQAALSVTSEMGTGGLGQFIPAVQFIGPAAAAGVRKYLLALKELGNIAASWQVRSDGRQAWGDGTNSSDVFLSRNAAAQLLVDGTGGADASLAVAKVIPKTVAFTDTATPASPGVGAATLYGAGGGVWGRNAAGPFQIKPTQEDRALGQELSLSPAYLSTSTSGPQMTAATAVCAKLHVPSARTLQRLSLYIQTAGTGLAGCYLAAYLASDGSLVAATADQGTSWQAAGVKNVAVAAGAVALTVPADVWVLAWVAQATTAPRLLGLTGSAANWTTSRFGTLAGMTGAPPASINPGSISAIGNAYVLGLS